MRQSKITSESATPRAPPPVQALARLDISEVTKGETGKEENVKIYIILPLLNELGYTRPSHAEFEYKSKVGKADVALLVKGQPKVIVEVKSAEKNLDDFIEQGLKYAIEKQIPFVLLTNGQEFRLYKSFIANIVNPKDRELLRVRREELITRFHELQEWISRDSLAMQVLDKKAERKAELLRASITPRTLVQHLKEAKDKIVADALPTMERRYDTDLKFQSLVDKWIRDSNLDPRNRRAWLDKLSREMAYAFINKLYFYRIAEDKGIVKPKLSGRVLETLEKSVSIHDLVSAGFAEILRIDYEAIFKDEVFGAFDVISAPVLEEAVQQLAQYDFEEMGSDIIGRIYEHHITREERRKLGQFYTPPSVIDFIIKNIEWDRGTTVLDPACGSGGFLIAAYDRLRELVNPLTTNESVHETLLSKHIYGVDINPFAAQLSAMNLALRDLEHRTNALNVAHEDSLSVSLQAFGERRGGGVTKDARLASTEWPRKYEVVVGNPPYFNMEKEVVRDNYPNLVHVYNPVLVGRVNIASLFVARYLPSVVDNGYFGFVLPKSLTYINEPHWQATRQFILDQGRILAIYDLRQGFEEVLLEQIAIVVKKRSPNSAVPPSENVKIFYKEKEGEKVVERHHEIAHSEFTSSFFPLYRYGAAKAIQVKATSGSTRLGEIAIITRGPYLQKHRSALAVTPPPKPHYAVFDGKHIQRYGVRGCTYINRDAPVLREFDHKVNLLSQEKLMCQRLVAQTGNHLKIIATWDDGSSINVDTVINIVPKKFSDPRRSLNRRLKFLLGLVNSKFASYYMYNFVYNRAVRSMNLEYISNLPIRFSAKSERKVGAKVDELLRLNARLSAAERQADSIDRFTEEFAALAREISRSRQRISEVEDAIDEEIFRLYGLNTDEINEILSQV